MFEGWRHRWLYVDAFTKVLFVSARTCKRAKCTSKSFVRVGPNLQARSVHEENFCHFWMLIKSYNISIQGLCRLFVFEGWRHRWLYADAFTKVLVDEPRKFRLFGWSCSEDSDTHDCTRMHLQKFCSCRPELASAPRARRKVLFVSARTCKPAPCTKKISVTFGC